MIPWPSVRPALTRAPLVGLLSLALGGCLARTQKEVGPAPDVTAPRGDAAVERGRYLGTHVAACTTCHSERDAARLSAPVVAGTEGRGGGAFLAEDGYPGDLYAGDLTPTALGAWTDGEILRATTSGLSRDGTPLFPIMPWPLYAGLTEDDGLAIVAWLRTLPPGDGVSPPRDLHFPLGLIVRGMPEPWTPVTPPHDEVSRGEYLGRLARCEECHTQSERGEALPGMRLAGGRPLPAPGGGRAVSTNLTPDPRTGLGSWTREVFIARFRAIPSPEAAPALAPGAPQTPMPWSAFAGMSDEDLGAIWAWLASVPPVETPPQGP